MDQIYKGTEEDRMEPYYYSKMNKVQQAAYHAIRQGLLEISDSIQIPGMEAEELYNVFFRLRLDHPEIFWATGYKYKYYSDSPNFIFIPEYLFDKNKIKEHQKALKSRVEKLIRPVKDKSEWEKEKYVHDFICENVHYDKLKKPYSHEIIGPLGQGVGVCEGIAKSVKVLCDALGIWCMIAVCGNNPEKGIKYRHTWNIVKIGGKYYHLDATFDNTLGNGEKMSDRQASKEIRYDYFNLDDRHIFRDHETLVLPLPPCTADKRYYYRPLSFTKPEDVENRARQALRKKQPHFVFHWRGGGLNREILTDLLNRCAAAAAERCSSCSAASRSSAFCCVSMLCPSASRAASCASRAESCRAASAPSCRAFSSHTPSCASAFS